MRLDLEPGTEEQKPVKQSFFGSLRRDTHWKCLILTLLIWGCLAAIAWCRLAVVTRVVVNFYELPVTRTRQASPCDDGYVYIPVAFVVMLYLVYLVECWHSHTRLELRYKVDVATVYDRIQTMREALPIVWWRAVCYHYVRRTRQVTRYRNGDAFTTTQVYYERVNSHTASSAFNFSNCGIKDISKKLVSLETYPATKIKFSKGFSFATLEGENEFEEQRAGFFQEHERRDDYMETREGLDLLNVAFKEYMIAFADPNNLPWYVSHVIFWLASLLLLSWPLRVLIEYKTAYVHYHVHKLFGGNYLDPNFCPPQGQMSRVSTMGSSELEMNIRNNYTLVPSYSEALLMDSGCPSTQTQDANGNLNLTPSLSNGFVPGLLGGNPVTLQLNGYVPHLANGHVQNGHIPNGVVQNGHVPTYTVHNGHMVANALVITNSHALNVTATGHALNGPIPDGVEDAEAAGQSRQHRRRRKKIKKRRHHSQPDLAAQCRGDMEEVVVPRATLRRSRTPTTLASTPESPEEYDDPSDTGNLSRDVSGEGLITAVREEQEEGAGATAVPVVAAAVAAAPKQTPQQGPPEEPPAYEVALTMRTPPVVPAHLGSSSTSGATHTELSDTGSRRSSTDGAYTLRCMETSL